VQYLHRKKNQEFDQSVRCNDCTVAGLGDILKSDIHGRVRHMDVRKKESC
jgi:hypothetical protein